MSGRPIKLVLNATALLSPTTGIAAYTRHLAEELLASGRVDAHFLYYAQWSKMLRAGALPALSRIKKVAKRFPFAYDVNRFLQQHRFSKGVKRIQPDLYHDPNYLAFRFEGPTVITVHDLSFIRYPDTHPADRVKAMNKHLPRCIERASQILVDSHFVKGEVVDYFGVPPQKVHAIHLGVTQSFRPRAPNEVRPVLARFNLEVASYIFAVGTLEPRKNLIQAIDAFSELPERMRKRMPLIVAGMKGWLTEELDRRIKRFEERGEVRWLGYVPAADLPFLYAGARLLVYPSIYEGFGLPILEAMASGIPVITTNRASLPEVAGSAGIQVDPDDRAALRDAIASLLEDEAESARRIALGLRQAERFTWRACAENTLAVYELALGDTARP